MCTQIEHGSGDARVQAIRAAFADGSDGEGGGGARAQPRGGPIFSSQQVLSVHDKAKIQDMNQCNSKFAETCRKDIKYAIHRTSSWRTCGPLLQCPGLSEKIYASHCFLYRPYLSHRPGVPRLQDVRLTELFEKFCGRTGYLDAITAALDAGVGKAAVGARLKALGLKRGVLTGGQVRYQGGDPLKNTKNNAVLSCWNRKSQRLNMLWRLCLTRLRTSTAPPPARCHLF